MRAGPGIEHYGEVLGPAQREGHIGRSRPPQPAARLGMRGHALQHRLREFAKSLCGYRFDQLVLILKVTEGALCDTPALRATSRSVNPFGPSSAMS